MIYYKEEPFQLLNFAAFATLKGSKFAIAGWAKKLKVETGEKL